MYVRLIPVLFALVLTAHLASALFAADAYELHGAQACEVGDGISVSGFVVRLEHALTQPCAASEGERVSAGQAHRAGYYSRTADGYEALLTPEFVKTEDYAALLSLIPEKAGDCGRLIEGQSWYFAAPPCERAERGQTLELRIGAMHCEARVLRNDGLLLLECREKLQEVTALRRQEAQLMFQTYRGLRIPKTAIYYEDGLTCVYILQGARARRTAIEILHLTEQDAIVRGELREGAQVIVTEIELRDGMVLQ